MQGSKSLCVCTFKLCSTAAPSPEGPMQALSTTQTGQLQADMALKLRSHPTSARPYKNLKSLKNKINLCGNYKCH